jgi:hypothetical protein
MENLTALMPDPRHIDIEKGGEENWLKWFDLEGLDIDVISRGCLQPCKHCIRNNRLFQSRHAPLPVVIRSLMNHTLGARWYHRNNEIEWTDPFFGVNYGGLSRFSQQVVQPSNREIVIAGGFSENRRVQLAMEDLAASGLTGVELSFHLAWPRPDLVQAIRKSAHIPEVLDQLVEDYTQIYLKLFNTLKLSLDRVVVFLTLENKLVQYNELTFRVLENVFDQLGLQHDGLRLFLKRRIGTIHSMSMRGGGLNFGLFAMEICRAGKGGGFLEQLLAAFQGRPFEMREDSYNDPLLHRRIAKPDKDKDDVDFPEVNFPEVTVNAQGRVVVFSAKQPGVILYKSTLNQLDPIDEASIDRLEVPPVESKTPEVRSERREAESLKEEEVSPVLAGEDRSETVSRKKLPMGDSAELLMSPGVAGQVRRSDFFEEDVVLPNLQHALKEIGETVVFFDAAAEFESDEQAELTAKELAQIADAGGKVELYNVEAADHDSVFMRTVLSFSFPKNLDKNSGGYARKLDRYLNRAQIHLIHYSAGQAAAGQKMTGGKDGVIHLAGNSGSGALGIMEFTRLKKAVDEMLRTGEKIDEIPDLGIRFHSGYFMVSAEKAAWMSAVLEMQSHVEFAKAA